MSIRGRAPRLAPVGGEWRRHIAVVPAPAELTCLELAETWTDTLRVNKFPSLDDYRSVLGRHVVPAFGELLVSSVVERDVVAWYRATRVRGFAPRTAGVHLTVAAGLFDFAIELGVRDDNPVRRARERLRPSRALVDPARGASQVVPVSELSRLLYSQDVEPEGQGLSGALYLTGQRIMEISGLSWRHYFAACRPLGEILVEMQTRARSSEEAPPKDGAVKHVPVHPRLAELIEASKAWCWLEHVGRMPGPDDPLFPIRKPYGGVARWTDDSGRYRLRKALQAAGIADPSSGRRDTRSGRHTFCSLVKGASRAICHPSTVTDRRDAHQVYEHFLWPELCEAVTKSIVLDPGAAEPESG